MHPCSPHTRIEEPALTLSPREQEIVHMVAKGYPNKTIAAVLEISSWTVSTHLRRVFAKVGVRTRAAMVARALADHLIADEPADDGLEHQHAEPSSITPPLSQHASRRPAK